MTENEKEVSVAIEHLKARNMSAKHIEMAIQAIEELQSYRAIGTVEEIQNMKDQLLMVKDMCKDYYEIGSIEEFKTLKEKNEPKKPFDKGKFADLYVGLCSVCGEGVNSQMIYCDKCGFALDWQ